MNQKTWVSVLKARASQQEISCVSDITHLFLQGECAVNGVPHAVSAMPKRNVRLIPSVNCLKYLYLTCRPEINCCFVITGPFRISPVPLF